MFFDRFHYVTIREIEYYTAQGYYISGALTDVVLGKESGIEF